MEGIEQGIELGGDLGLLAAQMASKGGGVPIDPKVLEQEAAAKEAAQKAAELEAKNKTQNPPKTDDPNKDTNTDGTDEEIQAKLDTLSAKEEKDLTDDEKKFIEKYTQEELDEINFAKSKIEERYGFKIEGEFANDEQGLADLVTKASKLNAERILTEHFNNVPLMADFYKHIFLEKRSFETFINKNAQPSYKAIKIEEIKGDEDDTKAKSITDNYRKVISMDYQSKGVSQDEVNDLISLWEDKGILFDKAKLSYNALETKHKAFVDSQLKAEEEKIKAIEEDNKKTIAEVNSILEKNDFGGMGIPATDLKAFKEALFKEDVEGNTLVGLKRQALTLGQRLMIDYLVFKDFKGVGITPTTTATARKFLFKKAAEANEARGGGRLRGTEGQQQQTNFKHPDFKTGFSFITG